MLKWHTCNMDICYGRITLCQLNNKFPTRCQLRTYKALSTCCWRVWWNYSNQLVQQDRFDRLELINSSAHLLQWHI